MIKPIRVVIRPDWSDKPLTGKWTGSYFGRNTAVKYHIVELDEVIEEGPGDYLLHVSVPESCVTFVGHH